MGRNVVIILLLTSLSLAATAQKRLFTKTGIISFYSKTNVEKIEAKNSKALAVIDIENNKIEFTVLIKGFEFEKALMEEHFNENYLESDKYPKAIFKGSFNETPVLLSSTADKIYALKVSGNLTMHGVTKPVVTVATITVKNKVISASCDFVVLLSDYAIKVPALVANNISKTIQVKINIPSFQEMK